MVDVIFVAGWLRVTPSDRDEYVASCRGVVRTARMTSGCVDFAITADSVEPDRVNIFEQWDSREALETFRGAGPSDDQSAAILEAQVTEHEVPRQ